MSKAPRRLLLDTHTLLWFLSGELADEVRDQLVEAEAARGLLLSPISVWELALLSRPRGGKIRLQLAPSAPVFLQKLVADSRLVEAPLTSGIALDAACLPGVFHKDPADRFLIATARWLGVPLVTRDYAIQEYAKAGHVGVVAC